LVRGISQKNNFILLENDFKNSELKKSHSLEIWQTYDDPGYHILNNGTVTKNNYV